MEKKCFRCNCTKPIDQFYSHKGMKDGHIGKCKQCAITDSRNNPNSNDNDLRRYRHSPKRIMYNRWYSIKRRCTPGTSTYRTSYEGRLKITKEEWDKFCKENIDSFMSIYNNWVSNNFSRKFSPSIDRIDNNKGYELCNLQWITQSENSIKGNKDKFPFKEEYGRD